MDSWQRMVNDDGTPRDAEFGAYDREMTDDVLSKSFEMMYGMIWCLAGSLAGETGRVGESFRKTTLALIDDARRAYESGVENGKMADRHANVVARRGLREILDNDDIINAIIIKLVAIGVIDPTKMVE